MPALGTGGGRCPRDSFRLSYSKQAEKSEKNFEVRHDVKRNNLRSNFERVIWEFELSKI